MITSLLLSTAQISPRALCPDAKPSSASCCYANKSAPVLGGVDFVDLVLTKEQGADSPEIGSPQYSATLNGYSFWFLSAKNAKTFGDDPWAYAPSWGGF